MNLNLTEELVNALAWHPADRDGRADSFVGW